MISRIYLAQKNFDTIINLDKKFIFSLTDIIRNDHWKDLYSDSNNFNNFKYNNNNQLILTSKKITKYDLASNYYTIKIILFWMIERKYIYLFYK